MNAIRDHLALPLISPARLGSSTWLLYLRSFAVVGQLMTILMAGWISDIDLPYVPLLVLVGLTATTNLIYGIWLRRWSPTAEHARIAEASPLSSVADVDENTPVIRNVSLALMLLDLVTLTAMLYFSGGAENPFSFFYFVNLAVGGVMIHPRAAWSLTLTAILGYAFILHYSVPIDLFQRYNVAPSGVDGLAADASSNGMMDIHRVGLMLAFSTCASVVTYFVTRTAGLLRDREQQLRRTEAEKAANRRLESLTTLAAGAAHELATPLSTIDVIARELTRHLDDVPKPVSVDNDLQLIDQQLEICRNILERMRGAAGDSMAQRWYRTTVGDLIDASLDGVRDPHRVNVVDGPDDVEGQTLWMPEEAVAQAIRNLIHNGLDASGPSGQVTLESRLDTAAQRVDILVTDQGQGMTEEVLGRIGDPFFTTKEPGRGIGLGLYLTRNVVSQLGGELQFSSEPGRGTTAIASLPLGKQDASTNQT
ncbi:sensor histidine kinase [Stieleria varia]|uniref:histidine kinase n=1 Tax=Stieleria varia TaxID=2528005 RepID=A0A5C5ZUU5_9BACT|nr:ATP-binding protein [Stieleria varia]TWT91292.1 Sensor histidine kinase RegB [Stieleria varia]